MITYPAVIYKDEPGYSAFFPDLGYIGTCGGNIAETIENATDLLAGHVYDCGLAGETVAPPSDFSRVDPLKCAEDMDMADILKEGFVNMISVDVEAYAMLHFEKLVKKTLSIPERLNKLATDANINFSQTLSEALVAKLFR